MSPERVPVFLARRSYRRRRLADSARVLPVAAGLLFCVPLLWQGGAGGARTVPVMIYVFCIWVGVVLISALLSRHLREETEDKSDGDGSGGLG